MRQQDARTAVIRVATPPGVSRDSMVFALLRTSTARRAQQHRHMPAHEFDAMVVEGRRFYPTPAEPCRAVSCRDDRQGRMTPRRVPGGRNRGASRSQPSREWIGGRLSPPVFIHDRPEPYRPDLVLWMELPDGFVVGQAVVMPEDTDGAVARTLRSAGRIPDFPVTRSHPPASWPSAANSSICRTYRKTAGEESRRRSPVANRWMRP